MVPKLQLDQSLSNYMTTELNTVYSTKLLLSYSLMINMEQLPSIAAPTYLPVVSELREPVEIQLAGHLVFAQFKQHISCMDLQHDHGLQGDAVLLGQLATHQGNNFVNLLVVHFKILLHRFLAAADGLVDVGGPVLLSDTEDCLSRPVAYPFCAWSVEVCIQAFANHLPNNSA